MSKNPIRWVSTNNLGSTISEATSKHDLKTLMERHVIVTEKFDGQNLGIIFYPKEDRFDITGRNCLLDGDIINRFDVSFVRDHADNVRRLFNAVGLSTDQAFAVYGELHNGDNSVTCVAGRNGFKYGSEPFWKAFGYVRKAGDDLIHTFYSQQLQEIFDKFNIPHVDILFSGTVHDAIIDLQDRMMSSGWEGVIMSDGAWTVKYKVGNMDDHFYKWTESMMEMVPDKYRTAVSHTLDVYNNRTTVRVSQSPLDALKSVVTQDEADKLITSQISKESDWDLQALSEMDKNDRFARLSKFIDDVYQDFLESYQNLIELTPDENLMRKNLSAMKTIITRRVWQMYRQSTQ